jgi:IMP dehydrogenase
MEPIKEALTFDDVLLLPRYSSIVPANTNITTNLSNSINLKIPFISSAMDTVTESNMAIAMAKNGGIGIIHRNLNIKKQCNEIKKVKKIRMKVGAAIGTSKKEIIRAKNLIDSGSDMIVIDTAHGHSKNVLITLNKLKKFSSKITICVGNIATGEAAKLLYNSGADILKVGIGPGSICTTRMVAGIGVPQITALLNVKKAMKKKKSRLYLTVVLNFQVTS